MWYELLFNRLLVWRLRSGLNLNSVVNTVIDLNHILTRCSLDNSGSVVQLISYVIMKVVE